MPAGAISSPAAGISAARRSAPLPIPPNAAAPPSTSPSFRSCSMPAPAWAGATGTRRPAATCRSRKDWRQSFRLRHVAAGRRVPVAPAHAGAGIEQDRNDGEVEGGAAAFGGIGNGAERLAAEIPAAGDEMAPAGMERHVEARVIGADDLDHQVGGGRQPVDVDGEGFELAVEAEREHPRGALAHGRSGQERTGGARRVELCKCHAGRLPQKSSILRPTTLVRSSWLGGATGVK